MAYSTLHYAQNLPAQSIDFFPPPGSDLISTNKPLLIYVHGGAWRSGDNTNLHPFASRFTQQHHVPVALVNYRLTTAATPEIVYPMHARDVLDAINYLLAEPSLKHAFNHSDIHLAGHSCGAHIISTIIMDSSHLDPSRLLLKSIQSISMSEGLYDLDLLLSTWPSYRSFVRPPFGDLDKYRKFSPSNFPLRRDADHIRWFIIHSPGDELVDIPQSSAMYKHLLNLGANVRKDWSSLHGKHDDILSTETYVDIIAHHVFTMQS